MLSRLPGVGLRNARKAFFELATWSKADLGAFITLLDQLNKESLLCDLCGCMQYSSCRNCSPERDLTLVAFVAHPIDVMLIEDSCSFSGTYHVLGDLLAPERGVFGCHLFLETFEKRLLSCHPKEILFAFEATLEGDATSFFVKKQIEELCCHLGLSVPTFSRIGFGIPMGSRLSNSDPTTIAKAVRDRKCF
ncbi:Recombination protein RecR [Candidatus Similichlamydia laticola]|uniref:Recombination protein RecR n=1 Tax=Candidatus Similichlamydia laticola TaxID=2170265 RepID=A0A369KAC5_9BACT|nr:Recombination protein RecR [Candidatus Similichlamydia laticola]